ncbi:transporter [Nitrogeniibacter mangrovi]|uniref:Transporter n=2 Tax=Nitrogeniibacter mangrovi TaxID=2016596 RepID=A0A6C1B8B1_9RHOO|nr:transporter [Nitrogeniibacter mangrovi]
MGGLLAAAALGLTGASPARAVTIDAGDITRLPAGTNLAVLYLQHSSGDTLYADGDKVSGHARLSADVGIARGVHYTQIGEQVHALQFLQPFGRVTTGGDLSALKSANGIGDLILVDTIHLINDPEGKRAFVVSPWLWLPTGKYDRHRAINALGENRWKFALQVGYMTPIPGNMMLDVIGDVTVFGANGDFGPAGARLRQKPLYELQAHLRYPLSDTTYVSPAISYSWGGETEIDGVDQDDAQRRTKCLLSVGHFLTPSWQILGSAGTDLSVRNGVKEDVRINLRLLKIF